MTAKHRVIGIGGNRTHLEGYIRSFAADTRCDVVAITDEPNLPEYREKLNRSLAAELDVPYLPLDEALALDGIDIACACLDIERRGRVLERCFEAGMHVYMDKPLVGSVDAAQRINAAAERAGTVAQMFSQAHTPWAQNARDAIKNGSTGKVLAIHCDMLMAKGHLSDVPESLVRQERGSDGNFTFIEAKRELFDMGVYPVSLVTWLSGQRVRKVQAITANYFFREHAELDIEDFGAMLLTLVDGTPATIMAGRIGVHSHPMTGQQQISLITDNGYYRFGHDEPRIEVYSQATNFENPDKHEFDPMMMWASTRRDIRQKAKESWLSVAPSDPAADVRAFLDCIESGSKPEIASADAVHHVEVIMAGYESARSGRAVLVA